MAMSGASSKRFLPWRGEGLIGGKVLVMDPEREFVRIKKRTDIEKDLDAYLSCPIPSRLTYSRRRFIGIYVDSKTESMAFTESDIDRVLVLYIGLSIRQQLQRLFGSLDTLYIEKLSPANSPSAEERATFASESDGNGLSDE